MIILKPERPKKQSKSWRRIKRKMPMLAGLAVFVGLFYLAFFSGVFTVKNIEIQGTKNISTEKLNNEIRNKLDNRFLLVFPSNNLLIASKVNLGNYLKDKFKRIETIEVNKKFFGTIQVSLVEKRGAFKWCRDNECFLVNEQGRVYNVPLDESTLSEEEKSLLVIKEPGSNLPSFDEQIIDNRFIKAIWQINDNFSSEIAEFSTPSILSHKIAIKTKDGWLIIFSADYSIEKQLTNFKALFPDQITLEQKKNLEYIDLSVEGRAYYKMKN